LFFSLGMDAKVVSGTFKETRLYQAKYKSLLDACDAHGTMVFQDRLLEKDRDISPYRFFRRGTREYVFPPQEVTLAQDNSKVIDPSVGYELKTEDQTFEYDQSTIEGRIRIEYDDAGNRPELRVVDMKGDSVIPKAVGKTLEDIF